MGSLEKETKPEVFVVVPSHDHAPFIERCLRSIIGQTLRPKKLLVIDDGSKDASIEIIENVFKDSPFECELHARENRGLCATLNEGLERSGGEFFAYLGSDDVWLPKFLEEQTSLLNSRPQALLAFSHAYVIDEHDNIIDSTANWTSFADGNMQSMLLNGTIFSSPGVLYRRSALEGHRWNEDSKLEDYEMYLTLSTEGEFARNEKILSGWRVHGENASGDLPLMTREMIAAQDRLQQKLGLTRDQLDRIQTQMKFLTAENLVRHGFRNEAAKLFLENLSGAGSATHFARMAVRLAIPQTLFQWNRRRKRRAAATRFGKIDDIT